MTPYLTPEGVFLATLAAFILGALWYSPLLFLNAWVKGKGMTLASLPKRSPRYIMQTQTYSFIAHGCMAFVLAVIFDVTQVETLKVALSLGALLAFGFTTTTHFVALVYTLDGNHYDKKNQISFLIMSLYYIAAVVVMSAVLFLVR